MNGRIAFPVAAVALAAVAGGLSWAIVGADSSSAQAQGTAPTAATATVMRRDLVQHETVDGTLGYDGSIPLYAQGGGTVTALRRPGSVAQRGEALYWLDAKAVTLMYGAVPMWRPLNRASSDDADIHQLERNLVALGYDPWRSIAIDEEWDSATTAALKRWQQDRGLEETGAVELGEIAFLPGPRRVGQLKAAIGALLQPGAEVMQTSSTRRIVTVDLDADRRSLVRSGDRVGVELPDGSTLTGTIASVGKVAQTQSDPQGGEQSDPTIEVKVKLARGSKTGDFDEAPVDVLLAKETAHGALSVPVNALLALSEGGYAVEVVGVNGPTRLVRVEPGMFADGFVQITGDGVRENTKVVVPG